MRNAAVLLVALLGAMLGGCSVLDELEVGGPRHRDPSQVYLNGAEEISLRKYEDRTRYACLSRPLVCESFGATWTCRCPF